jgi:hypothetical protein
MHLHAACDEIYVNPARRTWPAAGGIFSVAECLFHEFRYVNDRIPVFYRMFGMPAAGYPPEGLAGQTTDPGNLAPRRSKRQGNGIALTLQKGLGSSDRREVPRRQAHRRKN